MTAVRKRNGSDSVYADVTGKKVNQFEDALKKEELEEGEDELSAIDENSENSSAEINKQPPVADLLLIDKSNVGTVIGHKGVVIQEIMRRSECKISIDQDFPGKSHLSFPPISIHCSIHQIFLTHLPRFFLSFFSFFPQPQRVNPIKQESAR